MERHIFIGCIFGEVVCTVSLKICSFAWCILTIWGVLIRKLVLFEKTIGGGGPENLFIQ